VLDAIVMHGDEVAAIKSQLVLAGIHADVVTTGNDIIVTVK